MWGLYLEVRGLSTGELIDTCIACPVSNLTFNFTEGTITYMYDFVCLQVFLLEKLMLSHGNV